MARPSRAVVVNGRLVRHGDGERRDVEVGLDTVVLAWALVVDAAVDADGGKFGVVGTGHIDAGKGLEMVVLGPLLEVTGDAK